MASVFYNLTHQPIHILNFYIYIRRGHFAKTDFKTAWLQLVFPSCI
jgi:hypothetical protein